VSELHKILATAPALAGPLTDVLLRGEIVAAGRSLTGQKLRSRSFRRPLCSRPEAQSAEKSEIVKTEAVDREEEGLVKERVEGRA
jgi:hypothetical protein